MKFFWANNWQWGMAKAVMWFRGEVWSALAIDLGRACIVVPLRPWA